MRIRLALIGLMLAAAASLAVAKRTPIDYAAYAGDPVKEIKFSQLYNWQRVTDRQMVVWTKPSTAYLLNLRNNCDALAGRVTVEMEGGSLAVEVATDLSIVMKGPVEEVFTGMLSPDFRARLEALP